MAIMALCSHLYPGGAKPFEPAEWAALSDLLAEMGIEPHELMSFSNEISNRSACDKRRFRASESRLHI